MKNHKEGYTDTPDEMLGDDADAGPGSVFWGLSALLVVALVSLAYAGAMAIFG